MLGWKRYLTAMQLLQFVYMVLHYSQPLFRPECTFPKSNSCVMIGLNVLFFGLFADFYCKAYFTVHVGKNVRQKQKRI